MYNVIVAIEWEKLGCKVCASMQNGAQVLKYLEEEKIHVDIIINIRISVSSACPRIRL